jgi:SpoU rRNA methylase family enzyme
MIKLVSLPFREGSAVLVLEGFEEAAKALRPE